MRDFKGLLMKLLLYTVLISCSLVLIVYSSRAYRDMVESGAGSENLVISLNYLKTKVKMGAKTSVERYNGMNCLVIDYEGYDNYIYLYNGSLMEIYVTDGYRFNPGDGEEIMALDGFGLEETDGYIEFTVRIDNEIRKLGVVNYE